MYTSKQILRTQVKAILTNFILSLFALSVYFTPSNNEGKQLQSIFILLILFFHIIYFIVLSTSFLSKIFEVKFLIYTPIFILLISDLFFLYLFFEDAGYHFYATSMIFMNTTLTIVWLFFTLIVPRLLKNK